MKAKDIINFINEDKFSKYTLTQIFDELGKEGFVDYIEELVHKVIKVENIKFLKNAKLDRAGVFTSRVIAIVMSFSQQQKNYSDVLRLSYIEESKRLWIRGQVFSPPANVSVTSEGNKISPEDVDIFNKLRRLIVDECVKNQELIDVRKRLSK